MRGTCKQYDQPSRDAVETLVTAFLDKEFRESVRGGFAEVPEGDVEELDALILALVKYRYSRPSGQPYAWDAPEDIARDLEGRTGKRFYNNTYPGSQGTDGWRNP